MERDRVTDLLTPSVEEEVHDGEEYCEEDAISEVKWEWEGVGGFWLVVGF